MQSRELLEILADQLTARGWPNCLTDAEKVIVANGGRGKTVKYKGVICATQNGRRKNNLMSHTLAKIGEFIVDIALPKGRRVYSSGGEYWQKSGNSIKRRPRR